MHGGTTEEILIQKVKEALDLARKNKDRCTALAKEYNSSQVSIYLGSLLIRRRPSLMYNFVFLVCIVLAVCEIVHQLTLHCLRYRRATGQFCTVLLVFIGRLLLNA